MAFLDAAKDVIKNLQENAAAYFEVIYKTTVAFWSLPEIPSGGNILTGAFASLLLYFARFQMGQSTDASLMAALIFGLLLYLIFICGVLVAFDPYVKTKVDNMRRLASVACVGITLGAGFIVIDRVLPWIGTVQGWADGRAKADWLVAFFSGLAAWSVLAANTLYITQPRLSAFRDLHTLVWGALCLAIFVFGVGLIITGFFLT
jgi:uncharacterized membrane protein (DUF485 family)